MELFFAGLRAYFTPVICGLFFFSMLSCESPEKDLRTQVRSFLKNGNGITCEERTALEQMVGQKTELSTLYDAPSKLDALIRQVGNSMRAREGNIEADFVICPGAIEKPKSIADKPVFDFYLENSASMNGYFQGNREFKDAMFNLLSHIDRKNAPVNLFFINTDIYPIPDPLNRFFSLLKPEYASKFGDTRISELNKILDMVANATLQKPDHISIVVSDYIYSIRSKDIANELVDHKYYTTLAIQKLTKSGDYGILIMKFESSFDGAFYDCKNQRHNISWEEKEQRPFFVWVISKADKIHDFIKDYRITELKGYKNHLFFQKPADRTPEYGLLLHTEKSGRFRSERDARSAFTILDQVETDRQGILRWSVGVNLEGLELDESYILAPGNYEAAGSSGGIFRIISVQNIDRIDQKDRINKGNATHFLVVEGTEIPPGRQTVDIKLLQKIPSWVAEGSTEDDTDKSKRLHKTFGLLHLVEGVKEAFDLTKESAYFNLSVQLNR